MRAAHPSRPPRRDVTAFTLVELLVVIGIIALLVSILLPTLSSVRRQAASVKCESALREIGNAMQLYAMENKGYAPVAKTVANYRITFNSVPPVDYVAAQYWPFFLAKYVTRTKMGTAAPTAQERAAAMRNILWGCPAFAGYLNSGYIGGTNVVQTGYGMNAFPEYTQTYPPQADPPNTIGDSIDPKRIAVVNTNNNWASITAGTWYKLKNWTNPGERALIGDSRLWLLETQAAPMNGPIPGQPVYSDQYFWTANGQTGYDFYRHGKYPPLAKSDTFAATGGIIAYNVLFADGHVASLHSREDGYKAARMRFPG